jgi:predicted AAA+ superfamily ATPase
VETAFFKHVFTRYYRQSIGFTYWRGKRDREVDIISDVGGKLVPFEVKYSQQHTGLRNLAGLVEFCTRRDVDRGYVITKDIADFGIIRLPDNPEVQLAKIPAALACYWLGQAEMQS